MNREEMVGRITEHKGPWDIIIIGGGATGVGGAIDAASRGHDVLLLEQSDFGKGTSSRSTKLVHGGVRYLQQGNVPLVMGALKERGIMRRNAPHLVSDLAFIVPNYTWWEAPFYGIGMKVYDVLAGRYGFGRSKLLKADETKKRIPTIQTDGLRGGVIYYDGQFDDARMLINMVQTAAEQGAALVNYCKAIKLTKGKDGYINGVIASDEETGKEYEIPAKVVINSTGPFSDEIRKLDDPDAKDMVAASTGVHIVLDKSFLPGDSAIMVPHTSDGRVLFAIPWYDKVLVGTTDNPIDKPSLEPVPTIEEVKFILENAHDYLEKPPLLKDVLSVFSGIRPLVKAEDDENTAKLSRDHTITVSRSGLITISGGKWTTYRHMAEDLIDDAEIIAGLEPSNCVTKQLRIHGFHKNSNKFDDLARYGSDAPAILDMMRADTGFKRKLNENLSFTEGEVVWSVRNEMARTVDDVLARRTRALILNAKAAIDSAPTVARVMATEMNRGIEWINDQVNQFNEIAQNYLVDINEEEKDDVGSNDDGGLNDE